jgi:tetratricopeptide (TPR) repeat protein/predicted aspartyl protease
VQFDYRGLRRLALTLAGAAVTSFLTTGAAQAAPACKLSRLAELPITIAGVRPTVPVKINGHEAPFIIDSGAELGVLSLAWAQRLDVHATNGQDRALSGVGGTQRARHATIDRFDLAGLPLRRMDFFLADTGLEDSLAGVVGENILGAFDTEYDLANGVVRIFKPENCGDGDSLAYWSDGKASVAPIEGQGSHHLIVTQVMVNGQRMKAIWDTGAPRSFLTEWSAKQAGVTVKTKGAQFAGSVGGFGGEVSGSWIAPFDSFTVGGEKVTNTRLRFMNAEVGPYDMLLGFDFFLSHRVYVANSQHKVYFTYNGGPVFRLDLAQVAAHDGRRPLERESVNAANAAQAAPAADGPRTAEGYVRRAAASRARLNFQAAIADLTKAISLEPFTPAHYLDRAQMFAASGQSALAIADYAEVLQRQPGNAPALVGRGALYAAAHDIERARADFSAALKASPDNSALLLGVASVYSASGLHEDALALYDRWLQDHPLPARLTWNSAALREQITALNGACWSRAVLKRDLDAALANCNTAVELQPEMAAVLDSRGLVHFKRGEYNLAIADYDAALKLTPGQAGSLWARGMAKLKKGWTAEGGTDLQAALALNARVGEEARRDGIGIDKVSAP